MHSLDIYLFISICVNKFASLVHPYPTSVACGTGKRRLGVGGHALVSWCPGH